MERLEEGNSEEQGVIEPSTTNESDRTIDYKERTNRSWWPYYSPVLKPHIVSFTLSLVLLMPSSSLTLEHLKLMHRWPFDLFMVMMLVMPATSNTKRGARRIDRHIQADEVHLISRNRTYARACVCVCLLRDGVRLPYNGRIIRKNLNTWTDNLTWWWITRWQIINSSKRPSSNNESYDKQQRENKDGDQTSQRSKCLLQRFWIEISRNEISCDNWAWQNLFYNIVTTLCLLVELGLHV